MSDTMMPMISMLLTCLLLALATGCSDNCLEESTLVTTPTGLQPIGELKVGDHVMSVDPSNGAQAVARVARVATAWAWCEKLVIGDDAVWLTAEHPVYSPETADFRPAERWLRGDLNRTLSDAGAELRTQGGAWLDQRPCRVVDLSVADEPHTFVAAGIVVHNKTLSSPPCEVDDDCPEGFVCDPVDFCIPDTGAGGASGSGGASGVSGMGGTGEVPND